jgi:monofunctional biosynthetic peptidoglycan transglycosylase
MLRVLFKRFLTVVKWFAIGSVLLVLLFRVVPPPFTALMVERKVCNAPGCRGTRSPTT